MIDKIYPWLGYQVQTTHCTEHWSTDCRHGDVVTWTRFLVYCPFVQVIYWSSVDFHTQRASDAVFDFFFFEVVLNKLLNKLLHCQWFKAPWSSYDFTVMQPANVNISVFMNPFSYLTDIINTESIHICVQNKYSKNVYYIETSMHFSITIHICEIFYIKISVWFFSTVCCLMTGELLLVCLLF